VEKRVGFTFSDPAVGPLTEDRSLTGVITGPLLPDIESSVTNRGGTPAGARCSCWTRPTGLPVNNLAALQRVRCYDAGDVANGRKNAIQPT
jgi:hypothetical protein